MEKILQVENLSYSYRRTEAEDVVALDDVSFDVYSGEFIAVLGENGSGKSTLAKLLDGLLPPAAGGVKVEGFSTLDESSVYEVRKRVGMVFQNPDNQTVATFVEDDIAFGPENLGVPREEIEQRIDRVLKAVGMEGHRKSTTNRMSGGQKQRIAIASVLAMEPRILVLDEATSMLDPVGRKEVMDTLCKLNAEGVTVLHITHNMEEAFCASRVLVLNGGKLVGDGSPERIFSDRLFLEKNRLTLPVTLKIAELLEDERVLPVGGSYFAESSLENTIYDVVGEGTSTPKSAETDLFSGGEAVVEVTDLSHVYMKKTPYEKKALDHVTLTVKKGEFFGIIGATGSGKSTFIQHLNALIRVTEGRVVVDGVDLSARKVDLKRVRGTVGMVFQYPEYQLFEETVAKDIAFGPKNLGLSPEEVDQRVREAMEVCGLDESLAERSPFELSGGQKRRAAIAGVIAMRPSVLVFDEPTAGLDPCGRTEMLQLIKRLQSLCSPTVVMVSHNMDEIARYADRIAVFGNGKVVDIASPAALFAQADFTEKTGLELPVTVRVINALNKMGAGLPLSLVPEELASSVVRRVEGGCDA